MTLSLPPMHLKIQKQKLNHKYTVEVIIEERKGEERKEEERKGEERKEEERKGEERKGEGLRGKEERRFFVYKSMKYKNYSDRY